MRASLLILLLALAQGPLPTPPPVYPPTSNAPPTPVTTDANPSPIQPTPPLDYGFPVPPNPIAGWEQDAETQAAAQGYVYAFALNGSGSYLRFPSVLCGGSARPFTCYAGLPVTTIGKHTIIVRTALAADPSLHAYSGAVPFQIGAGFPGPPAPIWVK